MLGALGSSTAERGAQYSTAAGAMAVSEGASSRCWLLVVAKRQTPADAVGSKGRQCRVAGKRHGRRRGRTRRRRFDPGVAAAAGWRDRGRYGPCCDAPKACALPRWRTIRLRWPPGGGMLLSAGTA
jgi:hypothetical protein